MDVYRTGKRVVTKKQPKVCRHQTKVDQDALFKDNRRIPSAQKQQKTTNKTSRKELGSTFTSYVHSTLYHAKHGNETEHKNHQRLKSSTTRRP